MGSNYPNGNVVPIDRFVPTRSPCSGDWAAVRPVVGHGVSIALANARRYEQVRQSERAASLPLRNVDARIRLKSWQALVQGICTVQGDPDAENSTECRTPA